VSAAAGSLSPRVCLMELLQRVGIERSGPLAAVH